MQRPKRFLLLCLVLFGAASYARAEDPKENPPNKIKLPAEVDQIILAGRGDVLLLQMNKLAKIAVFDIPADKITGYIPMSGDDSLIAGTADGVVLIDRDKKVIQRWTLRPLEKALTVTLPLTGEIDGLVAGYASNAPAMIMTREGPRFLNPTTLKLVTTQAENRGDSWQPHSQYGLAVQASADGSTFAGWQPGVSPSGIRTLRLEGTKLSSHYQHDSAGQLIPSADGSLLFTGNGVYSFDLQPLEREAPERQACFPTIHPAYYVGLTTEREHDRRGGSLALTLYSATERTPLLTLNKLPGIAAPDVFRLGPSLSLSERIIAHPAAKKLLILDEQRTMLHIVPLDIVKALNDKGIDYLFVESLPVTTATRGKVYEYPIKVLSKAGKVKFTLDSGPEGLKISPEGVLRWEVPAKLDERRTSVIVTISDGSKQSLFHAFAININDAEGTDKPLESKENLPSKD